MTETKQTTYTVSLDFHSKKQLEAFVNAMAVIGSGSFSIYPNFHIDPNHKLFISNKHGGGSFEEIKEAFVDSSKLEQAVKINKVIAGIE